MVVRRIDYDKCSKCGTCHRICPMDVFRKVGALVYIAHQKDCMSCYLCVKECKEEALEVDGARGRPIPIPYEPSKF